MLVPKGNDRNFSHVPGQPLPDRQHPLSTLCCIYNTMKSWCDSVHNYPSSSIRSFVRSHRALAALDCGRHWRLGERKRQRQSYPITVSLYECPALCRGRPRHKHLQAQTCAYSQTSSPPSCASTLCSLGVLRSSAALPEPQRSSIKKLVFPRCETKLCMVHQAWPTQTRT